MDLGVLKASKDWRKERIEYLTLFYILCHQIPCPIQQWAHIFPGVSFAANIPEEPLLYHLPDSVPGWLWLSSFHSSLPPWPVIPKELLSIRCSTPAMCAIPPYLYMTKIVTLQLHTYLFFLRFVLHAVHTACTYFRNTELCWIPRRGVRTSPMILSCGHSLIHVHVVEVVTLQPCFDDCEVSSAHVTPFACHPSPCLPHLIVSCLFPSALFLV